MGKFNHAFDFAVEVLSDDENAKDVTPQMLADALRKRIDTIMRDNPAEMLEACGKYDTMSAES